MLPIKFFLFYNISLKSIGRCEGRRKQDRLGSKKVTDAFNFPSGVSLYLKHVKQNMIIYSSFKMKTLGIAWHARV